jgi:NADH:ubiquinone oxidoreductase subunit 4 (subunit M)
MALLRIFCLVKYIALLAMAKIVPTHAYLVAEHQDVIFSSIEDPDMSIRMRALELLTAMVSMVYVLCVTNFPRIY